MRKISLIMAAVMVLAFFWTVGTAMAEGERTGLVEYRVVSEMPVSLEEVVGLFLPGLLPSGNIEPLLPRDNKGLEVIRRWNSHLDIVAWKTELHFGNTIWLSARWVQWGPQNILERVHVPMVLPSGATQAEGGQFWKALLIGIFAVVLVVCAGFAVGGE